MRIGWHIGRWHFGTRAPKIAPTDALPPREGEVAAIGRRIEAAFNRLMGVTEHPSPFAVEIMDARATGASAGFLADGVSKPNDHDGVVTNPRTMVSQAVVG